jgi:hypothetical protein
MSGSRLAAVFALIGLTLSIPAAEGQKRRNDSFATVAGTVFREPGLALPGAKVVLALRDSKSKKLQDAETNYRGEFAFRVPAADAVYVVKASMKGYGPEEKEAMITGEERVEVNLVLAPLSK